MYYFKNEREGFIRFTNISLFSSVSGNLMKPETLVFEITSPTKKISLNYHLNKFSLVKYVKM